MPLKKVGLSSVVVSETLYVILVAAALADSAAAEVALKETN